MIDYAHLYFFFFNDTATTEIYTLSLHDALPIYLDLQIARDRHQRDGVLVRVQPREDDRVRARPLARRGVGDRKSTRLNSSHANISYAVFCLKKKKKSYKLGSFSTFSRLSIVRTS